MSEDGDALSDFELELPYELGRYQLDAEIGRGGMGAVYHAVDTLLDRPVAVKVLLPQLAADKQFVQRFTREAQMAARLEHPNIVTVHDVGAADRLVYFVMRLAVGKPLDRLMAEGLPWARAENIAIQVAEAVAFAHGEGVIHRDIKPENVIVSREGVVTITDFGLARPEQQKGGPTQAGVILGTPGYMAPEQALGTTVDHRADLYSFGVMLFELATGELPFDGETAFSILNQHINTPAPSLTQVSPNAPAWLVTLVGRLLEKQPDKRPGSMQEVLEVMRRNQGSELEAAAPGEVTAQTIVAKVRHGELQLTLALQQFPQYAATLQEAFRRERTVVSFDLAGSTALKQHGGGTIALGPVFNAYRMLVEGCLANHHVEEAIWAGDGTVALFENPSDAVTAAQEIVRGLDLVNAEFPNVQNLGVRVGIHTGGVLRDPNQPLGQVTSTTLDLTGHIQKDAKVGLVEVSQSTLDKLLGQEGWVPLRKAREGDLMIFAWHPQGPDHVPRSWVSRMIYGRSGAPEEAAQAPPARPGGPPKRPARTTQTPSRKPARTKPDVPAKLACPYCEAEVTATDQKCPDCHRLNRHYDPALDPANRKRRASVPAPKKKSTTPDRSHVRQTFSGRVADARRTTSPGRPGQPARPGRPDSMQLSPQATTEVVVGALMTCAVYLVVGFVGARTRAGGWWWGNADGEVHTRPLCLIVPGLLGIFLGVASREGMPALPAGSVIGVPLALLALYLLKWWQ